MLHLNNWHLLLLLFCLSIFSACGTNTEEEKPRKTFVFKESFYPDSTLKERWERFEDDTLKGVYSLFSPEGWLQEEHWFYGKKAEGPRIAYYSNGQIKNQSLYYQEHPYGDSYAYDSTGSIIEYQFTWFKGFYSFEVNYETGIKGTNMWEIYFCPVFKNGFPLDSGTLKAKIGYARPPSSRVSISILELDDDSLVSSRIELPLDTFIYDYQKTYSETEPAHFAITYTWYDSILGFSDSVYYYYDPRWEGDSIESHSLNSW